MSSWNLKTFTKLAGLVCFLFIYSFFTCCFVIILCTNALHLFVPPLHACINTLDVVGWAQSAFYLFTCCFAITLYINACIFYTFCTTEEKTGRFNLTSNPFILLWNNKISKYVEFVCITMLENNNKQYLVSYFYKHIAFLRFFL